jgi:hypothetical protein
MFRNSECRFSDKDKRSLEHTDRSRYSGIRPGVREER